MAEPVSSPEAIRAIAERVLSATFEGAVQLDAGESLRERTHVWRCPVRNGPADAPASVIVKCARTWDGVTYDPDSDAQSSSAPYFFNDWAGLQLLSQAA